MGTRLIIKNADFSENGIPVKLTELLTPLVVGIAWGGGVGSHKKPHITSTTNSSRASTDKIVDISSIAKAVGTVNLTPKSGYKISCYFGDNTADSNIITWGYTTSGTTLSVDISNCTHALIMVASNNDSELTSTDWSTYLIEK